MYNLYVLNRDDTTSNQSIIHIHELLSVFFNISTGITTVLTMAFLGIDNRVDLPKVSYSTAIDYFVGMCFAFVLASIVQFAGVHFFTKHGSGETFPDSELDDDDDEAEQVLCYHISLLPA